MASRLLDSFGSGVVASLIAQRRNSTVTSACKVHLVNTALVMCAFHIGPKIPCDAIVLELWFVTVGVRDSILLGHIAIVMAVLHLPIAAFFTVLSTSAIDN